MVAAVEAGTLALADMPGNGWGARPVTFTAAGQAAADALRAKAPQDNPRARCEITSVLFDWVFDGPVNRIEQTRDEIMLKYGRGLERTVHMDMKRHPANVTPSRAGHSIGHWEGDTLVVDTVGFAPGIIAGNVANDDKLHVVERFTLDPKSFALTARLCCRGSDLFHRSIQGLRHRAAGRCGVRRGSLRGAHVQELLEGSAEEMRRRRGLYTFASQRMTETRT